MKFQKFWNSVSIGFSGITAIFLAVIIQFILIFLFVFVISVIDPVNENGDIVNWLLNSLLITIGTWLVSNGAAIVTSSVYFSLCPLGITLLNMLIIYIIARRGIIMRKRTMLSGALTYSAITAIVAISYRLNHINQDASVIRAVVVTFSFSFLALFMANTKTSVFLRLRVAFQKRRDEFYMKLFIMNSLRVTICAVSFLLILSTIISVFSAFSNHKFISSSFTILNTSPFSSALVSILSVAFIPNIIIWNLSVLFSSGFDLGDSATFSTHYFSESKELPPIPVMSMGLNFHSSIFLTVISWLIPIIVGSISTFWLCSKNKKQFFKFSFDVKYLKFGFALYTITSILFAITFFTIGLFTLGWFATGEINLGTSQTIGLNTLEFTSDLSFRYIIGSLIVAVPFAIYQVLYSSINKHDIIKQVVSDDVNKNSKTSKLIKTNRVVKTKSTTSGRKYEYSQTD